MVCPHGQGWRRVEPVWAFANKRRGGVNFSQFCAGVFYVRPLMDFLFNILTVVIMKLILQVVNAFILGTKSEKIAILFGKLARQ